MLLYKSIMVSKSVATAEHKCPSECPLMIYRFALYILLSASPSILAIAKAAAFIIVRNQKTADSNKETAKVGFESKTCCPEPESRVSILGR